MNKKEREKWGKILDKWGIFYLYTCCYIGGVIGILLAYFIMDELFYELLIVISAVYLILLSTHFIKRKRKKDNLPEIDERITRNLFRFFSYTSHISLAILFISMFIATLLGKESISLVYLYIFFILYLWVVGVGTMIIKRT